MSDKKQQRTAGKSWLTRGVNPLEKLLTYAFNLSFVIVFIFFHTLVIILNIICIEKTEVNNLSERKSIECHHNHPSPPQSFFRHLHNHPSVTTTIILLSPPQSSFRHHHNHPSVTTTIILPSPSQSSFCHHHNHPSVTTTIILPSPSQSSFRHHHYHSAVTTIIILPSPPLSFCRHLHNHSAVTSTIIGGSRLNHTDIQE